MNFDKKSVIKFHIDLIEPTVATVLWEAQIILVKCMQE
jgi:hypothetical protein